MKAPSFGYLRPGTLAEALSLLARHGPDARLLAGGQSLLAALAFRLSEPSVLIDISRLAELRGVSLQGSVLRIGAATTHAELGADALVRTRVPLLAEAVPHIAHAAIRNRGTIGGSLAYADPAAELPACCVALGAQIVVASGSGERRVPAADFFTGLFATQLEPGDILSAVEIPAAPDGQATALAEITRRAGDYAMAGVAVRAGLAGGIVRSARLVFFGVGDVPTLAKGAAAALEGQALSAERVAAAKAALGRDLDPPADQHGSAQTKRHLAGVVMARALARLGAEGARAA